MTPDEFRTEVSNVVTTIDDLVTKAETVQGLPAPVVGILEAASKVLGVGLKVLADL